MIKAIVIIEDTIISSTMLKGGDLVEVTVSCPSENAEDTHVINADAFAASLAVAMSSTCMETLKWRSMEGHEKLYELAEEAVEPFGHVLRWIP